MSCAHRNGPAERSDIHDKAPEKHKQLMQRLNPERGFLGNWISHGTANLFESRKQMLK